MEAQRIIVSSDREEVIVGVPSVRSINPTSPPLPKAHLKVRSAIADIDHSANNLPLPHLGVTHPASSTFLESHERICGTLAEWLHFLVFPRNLLAADPPF
jgi:hypothetical protein